MDDYLDSLAEEERANDLGIDVDADFLAPAVDANPDERHLVDAALASISRETLVTLARDLYDLHLRTGISLDKWKSARTFVEALYGPIEENGV